MATETIKPFSLKDAPALIESAFPVQRLSSEVYKERMAGSGQTLTALGSYWKGRKPLILNKACVLASLLPATESPAKDLEVFELLMGMDDTSMEKRLNLKNGAKLPIKPYRELVKSAKRPEEIEASHLFEHIWSKVNEHLGTCATSIPELVEQLGIMRFGHRPVVADTFSGSGQIPFEAARLGCDVIASDLNPISCMLTWGAFNIVGASPEKRVQIEAEQRELVAKVKTEIDALGIESDGRGWRGKVYLYCLEVTCPTSGWKVPVLPSRVVSKGKKVIAELVPDAKNKRYDIALKTDASDAQMAAAEVGTYQKGEVVHRVGKTEHRNKISSIRGDHEVVEDGKKITKNRLRRWEINDVVFRPDDIYQERLYAIQWIKDDDSTRPVTEFRSVTAADLAREAKVTKYVQDHLAEWQTKGWVPDMRIEMGYNTRQPIWERGWTHWHHLFNPRQLLVLSFARRHVKSATALGFANLLNWSARLSMWNVGNNNVQQVYSNQALNTLFNYGCRGMAWLVQHLSPDYCSMPFSGFSSVIPEPSANVSYEADIFVTDPPYGDAVKYEEILEFFIAWLRKNPPAEFADWVWDSRRALAVKGEDHDFKLSMVKAYKRMTECMPDNGLQIVMFTHQSGAIWADMANIVWAAGLKVSAAWYIVTETDSALRDGQYVKGTILLVLRKRTDQLETFRDELAYELQEEVERQVEILTGLNQSVKARYRDENLYEDADIQMAGYAAALRVLTRYATIDGCSMAEEALRPRLKGQTSMVDNLIEFAVAKANEYLIPEGLNRGVWEKLTGAERFYLKMLDAETKGLTTLANFQNFAKAFKVTDYGDLMTSTKANQASLKSAAQFAGRNMTSTDEFGGSATRALLYGIYLLMAAKTSSDDVIHQMKALISSYYNQRDHLVAVAHYIFEKLKSLRPEEATNAMVLRDLIRNEGT